MEYFLKSPDMTLIWLLVGTSLAHEEMITMWSIDNMYKKCLKKRNRHRRGQYFYLPRYMPSFPFGKKVFPDHGLLWSIVVTEKSSMAQLLSVRT